MLANQKETISTWKVWPFYLLILLTAGCVSTPGQEEAIETSPGKLSSDLQTLESLRQQLTSLDSEFTEFRQRGNWQKRGYFDAAETREVEYLLFRFTAYHTALWDMVHSYGGVALEAAESRQELETNLLSASALLLLVSHTAHFVAEFAEDEIAIEQLNQTYFRSEIPYGTYNTARDDVTNPDYLAAVRHDRSIYDKAIADADSELAQLIREGGEFSALISQLPALFDEADQRLDLVAALYPSRLATELSSEIDSIGRFQLLYAIQSVVFENVSRLKSPTAHLIKFSEEQKEQVLDLLEPGDLVLTYTAGYMSSLFIPGAFKHGITFIGTPAQRTELALTAADSDEKAVYEESELNTNLQKLTLQDGRQADMIEAVAEGVIFNNLSHIMDTHINRMLVLRPRLSEPQRRAFLVAVYSYLDNGYDFRFDFADPSEQVCTEVIFRAINGREGIDFQLTDRAGHPTLSADDVVNYYLQTNPAAFELVLYAEEDPESEDHQARILLANEGADRVRALMKQQSE